VDENIRVLSIHGDETRDQAAPLVPFSTFLHHLTRQRRRAHDTKRVDPLPCCEVQVCLNSETSCFQSSASGRCAIGVFEWVKRVEPEKGPSGRISPAAILRRRRPCPVLARINVYVSLTHLECRSGCSIIYDATFCTKRLLPSSA
jgi:hypothetical protein